MTKNELRLQAAQKHLQEDPEATCSEILFSIIWDEREAAGNPTLDIGGDWDDQFICDDTLRLYYIVPENEGAETLCVWEYDRTGSRPEMKVGTIKAVQDELEAEHAREYDAQKCIHCGWWTSKKAIECEGCNHYLDRPDQVRPEIEDMVMDTLGKCIEDGGSDRYRWLLNERIETHVTKANHTFVFITLQQYPGEGPRKTYMDPDPWLVSVEAVNVGMAGKEGAKSAQNSWGMSEEDWKELSREGQAQALLDYGIKASLFEDTGFSPTRLLGSVLSQLSGIMMTAGFRLDGPQNAIGATGWDFLRGDLIPKRITDGSIQDIVKMAVEREK